MSNWPSLVRVLSTEISKLCYDSTNVSEADLEHCVPFSLPCCRRDANKLDLGGWSKQWMSELPEHIGSALIYCFECMSLSGDHRAVYEMISGVGMVNVQTCLCPGRGTNN